MCLHLWHSMPWNMGHKVVCVLSSLGDYALVTLMQMSAYSTHKNLAVPKTMEVMRNSVCRAGLSLSTSQTTRGKRSWKAHKFCERKLCIICKHYFSILLNCLMVVKVLLECVICFSMLVLYGCISKFCVQISRLLAYSVHISLKASTTTDGVVWCVVHCDAYCFLDRPSRKRDVHALRVRLAEANKWVLQT